MGEIPRHSAPTLTAAQALRERAGCSIRLSGPAEYANTGKWREVLRTTDVVIVVMYEAPNRFFRRQMALAAVLGKPVIRWWVGSDVLNVLEDRHIQTDALRLNTIVSTNIAVAAHLRDELASVGILAAFVPSLLATEPTAVPYGTPPQSSLLVYLPATRREFYGYELLQRLVQHNPELLFLVVGDETHSLARYPNVKSLGWVDDMSRAWDSVGGLLRITSHDGMPRMVLDALRREKHVIYSWPFPGCRLAKTAEDIQAALDEFKGFRTSNRAGPAAVKELLDPDPAVRFARLLQRAVASPGVSLRLRAASLIVTDTLLLKLGFDQG